MTQTLNEIGQFINTNVSETGERYFDTLGEQGYLYFAESSDLVLTAVIESGSVRLNWEYA